MWIECCCMADSPARTPRLRQTHGNTTRLRIPGRKSARIALPELATHTFLFMTMPAEKSLSMAAKEALAAPTLQQRLFTIRMLPYRAPGLRQIRRWKLRPRHIPVTAMTSSEAGCSSIRHRDTFSRTQWQEIPGRIWESRPDPILILEQETARRTLSVATTTTTIILSSSRIREQEVGHR